VSRHISVGIDLGSHATRVVVLESDTKKRGFHIAGTGLAKSAGVRHGYVVNQKEASQSIREALVVAEKSAQVKIRRALISIGGLSLEGIVGYGSHIISRVDGEVGALDIKQVVKASESQAPLANKRIIREFPLFFKLDTKEVLGDPTGMHGNKLETKVLFVASLAQHFENLVRSVENAGIEVEDVVPSPFAASIVALTKAQRTAGCVLANIGAETVSIVVFEDDRPLSLQVFPLGGRDVTNDVALGLRVSLEEAETIKTTGRSQKEYPHKKIEEIVNARLVDMFDLIEAHLKKINKNWLLPAGIIFIGGSAHFRSIEDLARTSLRLPARVAGPFAGGQEKTLDTAWAVAYGLALLGFDDSYTDNPFHLNDLTGLKDPLSKVLSWAKQFLP